jgi:hypothetical protein
MLKERYDGMKAYQLVLPIDFYIEMKVKAAKLNMTMKDLIMKSVLAYSVQQQSKEQNDE